MYLRVVPVKICSERKEKERKKHGKEKCTIKTEVIKENGKEMKQ
jgi:hypothetical protein